MSDSTKKSEDKEETKKESKKKEVVEEAVVDPDKEEKAELLANIQKALEEHGGMESNIGTAHPYWGWCNKYRGLLNK